MSKEFIDQIKKMSVMDLVNLVKAIEEEFGSEEIEPKGFFRRNSFEGSRFFVKKIKKGLERFFLDSIRYI